MSGATASTSPDLCAAHSSSGPSAAASQNDSDIVLWEAFHDGATIRKSSLSPSPRWAAFKFDSSRLCVRLNSAELDFLKGDSIGNDVIANVTASRRETTASLSHLSSSLLLYLTQLTFSLAPSSPASIPVDVTQAVVGRMCGDQLLFQPHQCQNPRYDPHRTFEMIKDEFVSVICWDRYFWKVSSNIIFKQVGNGILKFHLKEMVYILITEKSSVTPHGPDHIQRVISNLFQLGSSFISFNRLSLLLITGVALTNAQAAKVQQSPSTHSSCTNLHTLIDISPLDMTDFWKWRNVIKKDKNIPASTSLSRSSTKCWWFFVGPCDILPPCSLEIRSVVFA